MTKINAVLEGGGVKGTALVGAIEVTEKQGYTLDHLAGTSAGAIVASLLAAGYTSYEVKKIMEEINYQEFKDNGWEGKVPLVGGLVTLLFRKGIYKGDYFENLLRMLLAKKGIFTFGDLVIDKYQDNPQYRYKLQVVASDITRGSFLVLPGDIKNYGKNPDLLDVAKAVRMSMSIPFFYEPVLVQDDQDRLSYIVDGGLLSNFPVWLFDDDPLTPTVPTIGYKLVEPEEGKPKNINGPVSLFAALFSTMMEAHDARYIEAANFLRTIPIPTLGVQTTDFNLSLERKRELYNAGKDAAEEFFKTWSFSKYQDMYSDLVSTSRKEQLMESIQPGIRRSNY